MKKFILIGFLSLICNHIIAQKSFLNKEYATASGLKYKIVKEGDGERVKNGDVVKVHYVGKLTDETVFDSSIEKGKPFQFTVGNGQVIAGWEEGVALMNAGDRMILTVPPHLGYGQRKVGKIPANSTLIFEIELLKILPKSKPFDIKNIEAISTKNNIEIYKINQTEDSIAKKGKSVLLHYTLYLENNKKVDSSVDKDMPIRYLVGNDKGFEAWNEALPYMRVGEKARLKVPYQKAFGEKGIPPHIPEKATVYYDIEVIAVADYTKE